MVRHVFLGVILSAFLIPVLPSVARAAGGKDLFLEKKCDKCHSVASEKIEKQVNKKTGKKKKGPDLSGVGLDHDADWLTKFVKKEIEAESVYDKTKKVKHKKKFKGTDADLKSLVQYLAGLKTKVEVKEEAGGEEDEEEGEEKD
ncbi:MAG: c-type cytochrome [Nitrospirae bacterium]|nr:c-type cytochrome [Nitrospirota bacterium]